MAAPYRGVCQLFLTRFGRFSRSKSTFWKHAAMGRAQNTTVCDVKRRIMTATLFEMQTSALSTLPANNATCWNCSKTLDRSKSLFFCECNVIQPPRDAFTHFQLLGIEQAFYIDLKTLSNAYRNLQRSLHPDKFSNKSQVEKEFSVQQSSLVNKAYSTLSHPLSRGLYLLELHGETVLEGDTLIDPNFLMEIMEVNEELSEAIATSRERVLTIGGANQKILDDLIEELNDAFENNDVKSAKEILTRMKYYSNIAGKVKAFVREAGPD